LLDFLLLAIKYEDFTGAAGRFFKTLSPQKINIYIIIQVIIAITAHRYQPNSLVIKNPETEAEVIILRCILADLFKVIPQNNPLIL